MKRTWRTIFCICVSLMIGSCKDDRSSSDSRITVTFTKEGTAELFKKNTDSSLVLLDIEFAQSEYETQSGLMYRNSMKDDQGMLFIFEEAAPRYFYMKNTRIPLDIIYLSEDLIIVSFQKDAKPFDDSSLPSIEPAKYVLEINAGQIDELGIEIGDRLRYTRDQ